MNNINWNKMVAQLKKRDRVFLEVKDETLYLSDGFFVVRMPVELVPSKLMEFIASTFKMIPHPDEDVFMVSTFGEPQKDDRSLKLRELFDKFEGAAVPMTDTGLYVDCDKQQAKIYFDRERKQYVLFSMLNMGNFFKDLRQVTVYGTGNKGLARFVVGKGEPWSFVGLPFSVDESLLAFLADEGAKNSESEQQ